MDGKIVGANLFAHFLWSHANKFAPTKAACVGCGWAKRTPTKEQNGEYFCAILLGFSAQPIRAYFCTVSFYWTQATRAWKLNVGCLILPRGDVRLRFALLHHIWSVPKPDLVSVFGFCKLVFAALISFNRNYSDLNRILMAAQKVRQRWNGGRIFGWGKIKFKND